MKEIILDEIKANMRDCYIDRRKDSSCDVDMPTLITSYSEGYKAIQKPLQKNVTGEYEILLPEIPIDETLSQPILLFKNSFPKKVESDDFETDLTNLINHANRIPESYLVKSKSDERKHVIQIKDYQQWTDINTIHFWYYGLGSVLNASDFDNLKNKNIKTEKIECEELSCDEVYAEKVFDESQIGMIQMWGSSNLPNDSYLKLEGQKVYRNPGFSDSSLVVPKLFTAWGITGDSFYLPNMKGKIPIGVGGEGAELFSSVGSSTRTLTEGNLPPHSHTVTTHNSSGGFYCFATSSSEYNALKRNPNSTYTTDGGSGCLSQPFSIIQPSLGLYFIVKVR